MEEGKREERIAQTYAIKMTTTATVVACIDWVRQQGKEFDQQYPQIRKAGLFVTLSSAVVALLAEKYDVAGFWFTTGVGAYVALPIGSWWWKTQRPLVAVVAQALI
jgi:hypothetical protein